MGRPTGSGREDDERAGRGGRRVVLGLYVLIVAIAGLTGFLLGSLGAETLDLRSVALFGVIELPPSPLGLAVYGTVTVGLGLGVLLGLMVYVSRRYAD